MKNAIVIEDERPARELLCHYLEKYCEILIMGQAENVADGVALIREKKPDLIFLDISLPDHNGFELIRQLQPIDFEVIFVTAYDQYALQAIKMSAADYLLKPVDITELKLAVQKACERSDYKNNNQNLRILLENLQQPDNKRIAIAVGHSYVYEEVSNIVRLRAQGRYSEIYTVMGKRYMVTQNLGEYEKLLSPHKFLRVHHSNLINPIHIASFEKQDGGFLIMKDKSFVEVSRRNRELLISFMKNKH